MSQPTGETNWRYSHDSPVRPKKLTLEEMIDSFHLYPGEGDYLKDIYDESTADEKKKWDKTEIDKINSINNIKKLQELSIEEQSMIYTGAISPEAQKHMDTMYDERTEALANSSNTPEEFSGGRRRRNKKRSIIRKKKRGKKTRKYRNKY